MSTPKVKALDHGSKSSQESRFGDFRVKEAEEGKLKKRKDQKCSGEQTEHKSRSQQRGRSEGKGGHIEARPERQVEVKFGEASNRNVEEEVGQESFEQTDFGEFGEDKHNGQLEQAREAHIQQSLLELDEHVSRPNSVVSREGSSHCWFRHLAQHPV